MKTKLIGLLLLASSSVFAGWRVGFAVGVGPGFYPRRPVYVAPPPPAVCYRPHYYVAAPAPAPYVSAYVGPAPFVGAIWIPGRYYYGPQGRAWIAGHWGRR